jgi:hypothetical protein
MKRSARSKNSSTFFEKITKYLYSSSLYATCTFTLSSFPLPHPPKTINSIEKNNLKKLAPLGAFTS